MPVNPHFNLYNANNEQSLLENLIIESIKMYGFDTYYMPATLDDFDQILRESPARSFNSAIVVECYLKSNMKFEGDGKFMSSILGTEIRDEMTFTVSQKVFKELTGMERPREGDLMYLPLDKKVYEVKFVDHQSVFYQLGRLMVWDIQLELLEYSGEQFATGVPEIDLIDTKFDMDAVEENGIEDWNDQSTEVETEADQIIVWDESDPFSNGGTL